MTAAPTLLISTFEQVRRLAGPLVDKELRVASRRRKSYALRCAYLGLLTLVVTVAWFVSVPDAGVGTMVYQASRMGTAGRYIAVTLVWFQFIAAQILAVVLLGSALGEEIRKRTLPVLAITPISDMQILAGKLAGGLLPIAVLLATSLPLLAIVRVFGGVPWDYVVSGVCIAFTATVFLGILSLGPALLARHVLWGMPQTVWYLVLGRVFDGLVEGAAGYYPGVGAVGKPILLLVNPTDILLARTEDLLAARSSTGLAAWWPLHCAILLAGSVMVVTLAARSIRHVVAVAEPERTPESRMRQSAIATPKKGIWSKLGPGRYRQSIAATHRVEGSPLVWKDLRWALWLRTRRPFIACARRTAGVGLMIALMIGVAAVVDGAQWRAEALSILAAWGIGMHLLLLTGLATGAARTIAKEREARTLPVLLMTPLEDRQVIEDKARAVLRGMRLWVVPFSVPPLLLLFLLKDFLVPVRWSVLLSILGLYWVLLLGMAPFLVGLGLACSVWFRAAAAASACMIIVCLSLVLGAAVALVSEVRRCLMGDVWMWLRGYVYAVVAAAALAAAGWALLRTAAWRLRRNVF